MSRSAFFSSLARASPSLFLSLARVRRAEPRCRTLRRRPENLPYIESAPCNILAKIFLVPLSIAFWVLGACIWIALQLFRLAASPCL